MLGHVEKIDTIIIVNLSCYKSILKIEQNNQGYE